MKGHRKRKLEQRREAERIRQEMRNALPVDKQLLKSAERKNKAQKIGASL